MKHTCEGCEGVYEATCEGCKGCEGYSCQTDNYIRDSHVTDKHVGTIPHFPFTTNTKHLN